MTPREPPYATCQCMQAAEAIAYVIRVARTLYICNAKGRLSCGFVKVRLPISVIGFKR